MATEIIGSPTIVNNFMSLNTVMVDDFIGTLKLKKNPFPAIKELLRVINPESNV